MNTKTALDSPQQIVNYLRSGNAHYKAWCSVVDAILEVDPEFFSGDSSKSTVELVCDWIRAQKKVGEHNEQTT